jgi:hypothetical protein
MDANSIVALVVLLVIVVGGGMGTFFFLKARREKVRARIEAMTPEERERHDAVIEYEADVKAAEKVHQVELKSRENRLKSAQKAVAAADDIGKRKLGSYRGKNGSVSVTGTHITTSQGRFSLDASVNAVVDTAGNLATSSRSTLTRVAAGGILFGPVGAIVGGVAKKNKLHDTRELYLLVEGAGFATLVTCNPDDGAKVRQFALTVKQAGMNAANVIEHRAQSVAAAQATLEAETANTQRVDATAAALEAVQKSTTRIEAADQALAIASGAGSAIA